MSAELMAEITRLTAELQKISRIWDIAHEFQERHIAKMEEENLGQRAEIIELKAQRDCDREAIANYERMVGDHQGRAAAEVERLTGELAERDKYIRAFEGRAFDREGQLIDRLSLAEKLAKAAESYSAIHATIRTTAHAVPGVLSDGTWTAGCNAGADLRDALDAFISSASAERWACKTCGDTAIVARDANSKICWKCPSCMAMCSTPGDCDLEPECSFRPLSSPDHPTPPAQPSKGPEPHACDWRNDWERVCALFHKAEDRAEKLQARLTSLEEENAKLRAFRDAAGPETRERHRRRDINGLDWCSNPACIQKGRHPWPCPSIAALDATEGEPAGAPCVLCTLKACPDPTHKGYAR